MNQSQLPIFHHKMLQAPVHNGHHPRLACPSVELPQVEGPVLVLIDKEEKSVLELVTLGPLLLPFKEVKGLNAKMLRNLYLFRGKVLKAKGEDSKSNRSTSLEDVFITSSL